jgi:hypothetical protein
MSALPPLVHPCIDAAVHRASGMLNRAVDHALDALDREERRLSDNQLRQQYVAAMQEMRLQRLAWRKHYPQVLREAIERPPAAGGGMKLHPSSLSLVDDAEVMKSIEASRLSKQLETLVEQPLEELDKLMSSALGLDGVQPEQNPLRPEIFAQGLRTVMAENAEDPAWPALWMRHMAPPLAGELSELYREVAQLLKQARVQAASYRVLTQPGALMPSQPAALQRASAPMPLPAGPAAPAAPAARGGLSAFVDLIAHTARGPQLVEFLFRGGGPPAQQPLDASYYAAVHREIEELEGQWDEALPEPALPSDYADLPVVDRPARSVGTESPLPRQAWGELAAPRRRSLVRTRLKRDAQEVGQAIGLEVVRQLVDQVAQDERLLAPVREAVVALEPSLARLALKAPRFLGERDNPARQLVERVAERSFKFNDEFEAPFAEFFAGVNRRFNALNAQDDLHDATPFEQALGELEQEWAKHDTRESEERQRLLQSVRFAERRQEEAEQIGWTLGQRSDLDGVPAPVQDFLFSRWTLVMAHARLKDTRHEVDPGGYLAVVADLLWSVKRDCTLREPARAFELIPRVVGRLRAGLDLIGAGPADDEAFFRELEKLHRPVLKLRAKHRRQAFAVPSVLPPPEEPADDEPAQAEDLWLAPEELQQLGFEDTLPSDFGGLEEAAVATRSTAPAEIVTPRDADLLIAGLRQGSWVDLYSRRKWHRARLHWASTKATLFMFMSQGGRPHSMTRRTLHRLLVERLVRPIEGHEVVQHAIEALAQERPDAAARASAAGPGAAAYLN